MYNKTSTENTSKLQNPSSSRWIAIAPFLLLFMLIIIAATEYLYIRQQYRAAKKAAQTEISSVANLKAGQIENWYKDRIKDAEIVSNNIILQMKVQLLFSNPDNADLKKEILQWMVTQQKYYEYKLMVLYDSEGRSLLSVPEGLAAFDISHNQYFQAALRSKTILPIDLHKDHDSWKYIHLSIYIPIRNNITIRNKQGANDLAKGAWMIQIDPYQLLYPLVQTWPSARQSAETLLVRREGDDVLFLNELRHRQNTALELRLPIYPDRRLPAAMALTGYEGIIEGLDYRNEQVLADVRKIKGTNWFMVAKIDRKEIYAGMYQQILLNGIALLALLLSASLAIRLLTRQHDNRMLKEQLAAEQERNAAIEALAESRQKTAFFADVIEKSSQPFLVGYPDGRIGMFNDAFTKLLGYSKEEIEKINQAHHFASIRSADEVSKLQELNRTGQPVRYEKEYIRKDGMYAPIELLVHLVRKENGQPDYYYAFITDITERKLAEKAVLESKERLQLALTAANHGMYDLDIETGEAKTNPEYAMILGYDPATFVETNDKWIERLHPDDRERVSKTYRAYIEGKLPTYQVEFRQRTKSGDWKWILSLGKILEYSVEGKPLRMLGTHTDITERKQAEEKISNSETLLKQTQRLSHVGGWEYDVESRSMLWSDEVYNIHGVSKDYDPSNPDWHINFFTPENREKINKAFMQALEYGEPYDLVLQSIKADGTLIWVRTSGQAERKEGKITRVFGNIMDITERMQAEEQMLAANEEIRMLLKDAEQSRLALLSVVEDQKEAQRQIQKLNAELEQRVQERTARLETVNKELEAFSYSVSHDLRSPLQHITGFAELLNKRAYQSLDEKSRHYIKIIKDSTGRMGALIDDLLSFSRMGRADMMRKNVNLDNIVKAVLDDLKTETKERNIEWKINPLPEVTGDPAMLKLVYVNLISNAVKFTKECEKAVIEIGSTFRNKGEIFFYVKDNGAGFDMKYVDKLFGLFQRLHRSEDFDGTGLGLANVRRIIYRHGGKTWAEGEVDKGATIYFSLPGEQGSGIGDRGSGIGGQGTGDQDVGILREE
ncbi:MAG: PAS domain S-box protein [Proteobacteria bacterium]|nr:PAS domain S-box protein [Pseudomonadota bacterium]MBU4035159.1 PAS domain S-box protein [Pseudomonadota bacterium]